MVCEFVNIILIVRFFMQLGAVNPTGNLVLVIIAVGNAYLGILWHQFELFYQLSYRHPNILLKIANQVNTPVQNHR
jgi:hypothetical protein